MAKIITGRTQSELVLEKWERQVLKSSRECDCFFRYQLKIEGVCIKD